MGCNDWFGYVLDTSWFVFGLTVLFKLRVLVFEFGRFGGVSILPYLVYSVFIYF
jgi:hypothetical protein